MKRELTVTATLLIASVLIAGAVRAADEETRVVKKIRIDCEGSDCQEHDHGAHAFAWSSSDEPGHFRFRTHVGGAFLGVQLAELTAELRTHFGVGEDAGVMISKIVDDSPAARAGLEVGDIITALDGKAIGSGSELAHAIRGQEDGASVLLEVWRDGAVQNVAATVAERPDRSHGMDYAFVVKCDDDEEDCSFARRHFGGDGSGWGVDFDCGGEGPCEVKVNCDDDGDCACTVNGEETECSTLPGFGD